MDNEKEITVNVIMEIIKESINDVVSVHGEIHKVQVFGNALAIYFKDGNVYKQPFITKDREVAMMDALR